MGVAMFVQANVAFADAGADPAFLGTGARRGAGIDDRLERGIAGHGELAAAQGPGKRPGQMEAFERQNCAHLWLDPEHLRVVAADRKSVV